MTQISLDDLKQRAPGAKLSTSVPTVPADDYQGLPSEFREIRYTNSGRPILPLMWEILDDGVREQLKREKVLVKQDIWLDLTEAGEIDTSEGQNVSLGQIYKALGLDPASDPVSAIIGRGPALIRVTERADENDPDVKYNDVKRVAPLA